MTVAGGMHDWVKTKRTSLPSLPSPRPRFPESARLRGDAHLSRRASKALNFAMVYGHGGALQSKPVGRVGMDVDWSALEMGVMARSGLALVPEWECARCGTRCGSKDVPPSSRYRSFPVRCRHSVMFLEEDMGVVECDLAMASGLLLS